MSCGCVRPPPSIILPPPHIRSVRLIHFSAQSFDSLWYTSGSKNTYLCMLQLQRLLNAIVNDEIFGPVRAITFTCNPKWPEIVAALPLHAHWQHHGDITERVFMLKLKSLLNDIVEDQIFGPVRAIVYRVEWQARGYFVALILFLQSHSVVRLPHAHILVILRKSAIANMDILRSDACSTPRMYIWAKAA